MQCIALVYFKSLEFLSSGHCNYLFVMFMGMISKHTNVQWGVEQDKSINYLF